jgi:hypothetical protein
VTTSGGDSGEGVGEFEMAVVFEEDGDEGTTERSLVNAGNAFKVWTEWR